MKTIIRAGMLSFLLSTAPAWAAESDATPSVSADTARPPVTATDSVHTDGAPSSPAAVTQKTEDKKESAENAEFVDKDGDGINDGKEHRFRRKSDLQHHQENRRMMRKKKQTGKARSGNSIRNN